jgi:CRISPR-associated endonuclease Csn1
VKKLADAKAAIETAMKQVEAAKDDELDELCDEFPKEWKTKKRKGDDHWDREAVFKALRKLHFENGDAINEKDRGDDRHHALDAMVLSFLPHWAGNPGRSLYFGLPPGKNWKEEFGLILNAVQAESLRFEKPVLRETIYGLRQGTSGKLSAAIRREVFPMAYGGSTPDGKLIKFAVANLRSRLPSIRTKSIAILLGTIANDLDGIADAQNREKQWYLRCHDFRLKPNGPLIKKVSCWSDKPDQGNYTDMSKDWTPEREAAGIGQWRCAKGSHQGQWVYLDTQSKPRIRAVKVFESIAKVKTELEADSDCARVVMFLQSGCIVKIDGEVKSGAKKLPEGNYRVGGIEEAARKIDLYSAGGTKFEKIPLTSLLIQNFRRVN